MADCATDAAALGLRQLDSVLTVYQPEMENVPVLLYHSLLEYYAECNAVINAEIEQVMMEHSTLV